MMRKSYRSSRFGTGLDFTEKAEKELIKEYVYPNAMYFDNRNDRLFFEFSEDEYGKFVYLFKKEGKLYRLTC